GGGAASGLTRAPASDRRPPRPPPPIGAGLGLPSDHVGDRAGAHPRPGARCRLDRPARAPSQPHGQGDQDSQALDPTWYGTSAPPLLPALNLRPATGRRRGDGWRRPESPVLIRQLPPPTTSSPAGRDQPTGARSRRPGSRGPRRS